MLTSAHATNAKSQRDECSRIDLSLFKHRLRQDRVVVLTTPRGHRGVEQLLNDRGHRRGRVVLGERGHDVAHVLREQVRLESRLISSLERALAVHLEHPARCKSPEQRLTHLRGINPRFARQRERFGDDHECAADHHLVTELA